MVAFILLILFIWGGYEALKHYDAEKYAKKKVYGENIGFFSFMISNHPLILVGGIFLLILIIAIGICSA